MPGKEDDNVRELRRNVENTRAEMHRTIGAIQHKLDPERLKHQAEEAVREATIGRAEDTMSKAMGKAEDAMSNARETATGASSGIMDTIRQNPIPAAIAGLGLGWLFMNRSTGESPYTGYYGQGSSYPDRSRSSYSGALRGRTADSGYEYSGRSSSYSGLGDSGESKLGQVADKAGEAKEAAAQMMDEVRTRAGDMLGDTGETVVDRGSGLIGVIKENPLPAAIAGFGLGWLFMNGGSSSQARYSPDYRGSTGNFYGRYGQEEQGPMDQIRSTVGDKVGQAQETVGDITGQAQEKVGDLASQAQETVGDVSHMVQHQVGTMAHQTRRQYGRMEDRVQDTLDTNPLAVGAVALAIGAAAALMVPTTMQEKRFMGETRDNLMNQVQSTAQETMQKVQRVADHVQETAKSEAKEEGLT